jgi:hypothetical protein
MRVIDLIHPVAVLAEPLDQRVARGRDRRATDSWLLFFRFGLQNPFGFLQFPSPTRWQILTSSVNEKLDHADARTNPFWTHLPSGHRPGNSFSILRE